MTKGNRIDAIISAISTLEAEWAAQDAVIDHNLTANRGFDDYTRDWHDQQGDVRCARCGGEWHGLPVGRCPGAMSTDEAVKWIERREGVTVSGTAGNPIYTGDHIQNVRMSRGHHADLMTFDEARDLAPGTVPVTNFADRPPPSGIVPGARWVTYRDDVVEAQRLGYTLADIERMRSSWVRTDYPQQLVLGSQQAHRRPIVRFFSRSADGSLRMIEGSAEVLRIDWTRDGCTVAVRLDTVRDLATEPERALERDMEPVGDIPAGMIGMEGSLGGGFEPVGWLHPEDLDIQTDIDTAVHQWGGSVVRTTMDRYDTTLRINGDAFGPLMRQLFQGEGLEANL